MDNGKQIADTILAQLGGGQFLAMTGARNLLYDVDGLSLKFQGCASVNYLQIKLTSDDLYSLEFGKLRGLVYMVKRSLTGISAAMLRRTFTDVTGLDTHL